MLCFLGLEQLESCEPALGHLKIYITSVDMCILYLLGDVLLDLVMAQPARGSGPLLKWVVLEACNQLNKKENIYNLVSTDWPIKHVNPPTYQKTHDLRNEVGWGSLSRLVFTGLGII